MISKGKFRHLRKVVAKAARSSAEMDRIHREAARIMNAFHKGGFYIDQDALEKARNNLRNI